jgi:amino acid permease
MSSSTTTLDTSTVVEYGTLLLSTPPMDGVETPETLSTTDESETAHHLLTNKNARYSVRCMFQQEAWSAGTATVSNEILNLLKNIVGSGGLSLPAGIAAFGNAPSAILPSLLVIFVMAIINAYSFSLLGRVCSVTKSKTYQEAWDRSFGRRHGKKYNLFIGLVVTLKAVLGTWSFSIVIASTSQPLLQSMGLELTKSETLIAISSLVLLPLCLREQLSSLAGFSAVGQIGTIVTAFTMALRYFDGSYRPGGKYYDDVPDYYQPSFGDKGALAFFSPQCLILISILSQGYVPAGNAAVPVVKDRNDNCGKAIIILPVVSSCLV